MTKILIPLSIISLVICLGIGCQTSGCSSYKEGDFYTLVNSDTIYISRINDIQTEVFKGYKAQMKVEWISECEYNLLTISEINRDSLDVGKTVKKYFVKILSSTENTYTYETRIPDTDFVDKSIMYRR